jgi:transcriptional regulator with XRE-family HTH domain
MGSVAMSAKSPSPIDVYVGSRIRLQRNTIGMSQEKLGDGLGITFQQIQKYEKGTNRVGASRLQAIARILGVPVTFFFNEGEGSSSTQTGSHFEIEPTGVMQYIANREGLRLNQAFAKIKNAKARKKIIALVKVLADEDDGNDHGALSEMGHSTPA